MEKLEELRAFIMRVRAMMLDHHLHHEAGGSDPVDLSGYVPRSLFDANTILKADSDNTPIALAVAASRILGRAAAGGIAALTAAEVATLLSLTDYVTKALFDANTILAANADNTPLALAIAASRILGRGAAGDIAALTGAQIMAILTGQAGADFSMNTHKITNVVDPAAAQDAATKKYHDDNLPAGGYTEGCRVYQNADYSVADATVWVIHPFNSEQYDTDTMHDNITNNSRITFTTAGIYLAIFQVKWAANVTGRRIMGMRMNGATLIAFDERPIPGNNTFNMTLPTLVEASATDYIEAILYQNSGAALLTKHDLPANVYFMAQRIG